jgi:hypothetical protein
MKRFFAVLTFLALVAAAGADEPPADKSVVKQLVADTAKGYSVAFYKADFSPAELKEAEAYVRQHKDHTSYLVLLVMRKKHPHVYKKLPEADRAAVLCSGLAKNMFLNEWGHLGDYDYVKDCEPVKAVRELGKAAVPYLTPLLDDRKRAPFSGSADATASKVHEYRRCDFAYRELVVIRGESPNFRQELVDRDKDIARLKQRLTDEQVQEKKKKSQPK